MRIGFHASHEQFPPSTLLSLVHQAEAAGFDAAMCSDHFAPWGLAQAQSGYSWSWLAAALATTSLRIGVVTAPGQRMHTAVAAQAVATLEEMFPGRFWAALGSGEALNEHITGDAWPAKADRETRLRAVVDVMRRLLAGERVDHDGAVRVHDARLWTRPAEPPPLLGAAVSRETAEWVAGWADGLVTVGHDPEALRRVVEAYRDAGGRGPCAVQVHVALGATEDEALGVAAAQWRQATVPGHVMWDLEQPEDFDARSHPGDDEALRAGVLIGADADAMAARVAELAGCGFDEAYLHHVGVDQSVFIARAGDELLPALRRRT
ncbi:TIGR03885 family FMN-dependent LLM class oxidoreductase [Microbacterium sp. NPDC019599]|uniref:TIGR03885 family FMN-dependent LLM class oxidoreductase n=1 Tax=Microbacterium sp. NPDC019599 TaxID=3154690 RepID=UPI00340FDDFA